jgi:coenzyme F420-reducing hydrogenase gamma subunit
VSAIAATAVVQDIAVHYFPNGGTNFTAEGRSEESAKSCASNRTEQGAPWTGQSTDSQSQACASECSSRAASCSGNRAKGASCFFGSVFSFDACRLTLWTLKKCHFDFLSEG